MRKRRLQKVSEDLLTISRTIKRLKTSLNGRSENSLPIPIDLLIEIFSKLPVQSILTCRCVSKFWSYVLSHPDFTDLFLTKSSARPQILLACIKNNGYFISCFVQPQNPEENSSPIAAYSLTHVPNSYIISRPINGLVCLIGERILKQGKTKPVTVSIIYNPTTRESLTLPKTKTKLNENFNYSYLGYDPVEKQYKVLSLVFSFEKFETCKEHQVLTLGTGKLSWRNIECGIIHQPFLKYNNTEICINGVLYYPAVVKGYTEDTIAVFCFDVRSEKFSVMKALETFNRELPDTTTLINYDGKLGLIMTEESDNVVSGRCRSFELWILQDAGKHKWLKHLYVLPPLWYSEVGETRLYFAGMSGTNEIVLFPRYPYEPFYLRYNIEKKTIKRVALQLKEAFKGKVEFQIFLNHVENVKLIQA